MIKNYYFIIYIIVIFFAVCCIYISVREIIKTKGRSRAKNIQGAFYIIGSGIVIIFSIFKILKLVIF